MKPPHLLLCAIAAAVILAGCSKPHPHKVPVMTMTTAIEGDMEIWLEGHGRATVDWGDGSEIETITLGRKTDIYPHTYPDDTSREIVIRGEVAGLYCQRIALTDLDVSGNPGLGDLWCQDNRLATVEVSRNVALYRLVCSGNGLRSLDVSKNIALECLSCDNNGLTALDLSKNTALWELDCSINRLTTLDLTGNIALKNLYCYNNYLKALDLSKNIALRCIDCTNNFLAALDLRGNIALEDYNENWTAVRCRGNLFTAQGLNELFASLPDDATAGTRTIHISHNPGTAECDQSIAIARGWRVNAQW